MKRRLSIAERYFISFGLTDIKIKKHHQNFDGVQYKY